MLLQISFTPPLWPKYKQLRPGLNPHFGATVSDARMVCYRVVVLALMVVLLLNGKSLYCVYGCFCSSNLCTFLLSEIIDNRFYHFTAKGFNIKQHFPSFQLWRMRLPPSPGLVPAWVECVGKFASRQNSSLDLWAVEKASCKFWCSDAVALWICCVHFIKCNTWSLVYSQVLCVSFSMRARSAFLVQPRQKICRWNRHDTVVEDHIYLFILI